MNNFDFPTNGLKSFEVANSILLFLNHICVRLVISVNRSSGNDRKSASRSEIFQVQFYWRDYDRERWFHCCERRRNRREVHQTHQETFLLVCSSASIINSLIFDAPTMSLNHFLAFSIQSNPDCSVILDWDARGACYRWIQRFGSSSWLDDDF